VLDLAFCDYLMLQFVYVDNWITGSGFIYDAVRANGVKALMGI